MISTLLLQSNVYCRNCNISTFYCNLNTGIAILIYWDAPIVEILKAVIIAVPYYSYCRFQHPTSLVQLAGGIVAVSDYANSRIRIVDFPRQEVTSLCSYKENAVKCDIDIATALAVSKDRSHLFVGTVSGLKKYRE